VGELAPVSRSWDQSTLLILVALLVVAAKGSGSVGKGPARKVLGGLCCDFESRSELAELNEEDSEIKLGPALRRPRSSRAVWPSVV